jgi:hypothetical protein
MPTVLVVAGFRLRILLPPREHPPPHVPVTRDGAEAVLLRPQGRAGVVVRTVYRMRDSDVIAAVRLVESKRGTAPACVEDLSWRYDD